MQDLILHFLAQYPWAQVVLAIIVSARAVFKPLCAAVQAYVDSTAGVDDDHFWLAVQDNKVFKAITWFFDYSLSIKLPVVQAASDKAAAAQ